MQYLNDGPQFPRITEERLAGCITEHADQLANEPHRVRANVLVDKEGRKGPVDVEGIPDSAPDFAACVKIALGEMTVPGRLLVDSAKRQTVSSRNELANPILVMEALVVLGEFVAENAGRVVVYAVTLEVVTSLAMVAVATLSERCRRVKKKCIVSCTDDELPTWDPAGDPFHKCYRECMERARCFYNPP